MSSSNVSPRVILDSPAGRTAKISGCSSAALCRLAGGLVAVWLALSGALLAVRTLMHATQHLPWPQTMLATVGLFAVAWLSHASAALSESRRYGARAALLVAILTSSGLLLWAISLSRGTGSFLSAGAIFLPLIAEEAWAWRKIASGTRPKNLAAKPGRGEPRLVQQFTRSVAADGVETIQGCVVVGIQRGSRMGAAHVAFCPPFIERPLFDAHLSKPAGAALKVTHLYAHGARMEVRLPHAADTELCLSVRFEARSRASPIPGM